MKTISTITASAAALASVGTAAAQQSGQVYLELGLGAAFTVSDDGSREGTFTDADGVVLDFFSGDASFDIGTGVAAHLLVGYEVAPRFAVELQSQGTFAEIGESSDYLVMDVTTVNAVYTGDRSTAVIPYAGVGIGIANPSLLDDDGDEIDEDFELAFAYQAKAGVMKPVGVHHNFAAEVRYVGTSGFSDDRRFEFADGVERFSREFDYGAITATLNYRYRFGQRP